MANDKIVISGTLSFENNILNLFNVTIFYFFALVMNKITGVFKGVVEEILKL